MSLGRLNFNGAAFAIAFLAGFNQHDNIPCILRFYFQGLSLAQHIEDIVVKNLVIAGNGFIMFLDMFSIDVGI